MTSKKGLKVLKVGVFKQAHSILTETSDIHDVRYYSSIKSQ